MSRTAPSASFPSEPRGRATQRAPGALILAAALGLAGCAATARTTAPERFEGPTSQPAIIEQAAAGTVAAPVTVSTPNADTGVGLHYESALPWAAVCLVSVLAAVDRADALIAQYLSHRRELARIAARSSPGGHNA